MFNKIIFWSLKHRPLVLFLAIVIMIAGMWSLSTMKVDILPDINKPTVTIFAEAEGFAAEDVERLVLTPIEASVAGVPGLERMRSTASFGLAIINIEFTWDSDIYRSRQIIQERLSISRLPEGVKPVLGPVGSIMGEIMWVGITANDSSVDAMQLRTLADWTIRPALLRIPGVSEVLVMGGDVREWQINLNAEQMKRYGMRLEDVEMKIKTALNNKSGGILIQGNKEFPLRIMMAPSEVSQLSEIAIGNMDNKPIRLADLANVEEAANPAIRGTASINGKTGAILRVIRQPNAETLKVTEAVDTALRSLESSLPTGVALHNDLFRQEWFIHSGLSNVLEALRDGTILVIIILILFLMNLRITLITLTAIPLSILVAVIVFRFFDLSVNVMTLGGLAVAVGELVDDAIVDVENVSKRLREWRQKGSIGASITEVVFKASSEVRNSIVYATILVAVVFLPIFFIPGVEGRLLSSLGAAYLISLVASLMVSLSVTPVLSSYLLTKGSNKGHEEETRLVKAIKKKIAPMILWSIHHVKIVLISTVATIFIALVLYVMAGKEGIPPFNEGSATVLVLAPVGTDVNTSNAYASQVGEALLKIKQIQSVSHITGRAGRDAHESGSNRSEMQVVFKPGLEKHRKVLFNEIQGVLNEFGEADFSLGQPITHRVEELLSGVRSPVVIKLFGDNAEDMRQAGEIVLAKLQNEPTMKNPQIQKDVLVPEFRIYIDRNRLAEFGLSAGEVAEELEMGLMGSTVGQVRLGPASVDVIARYDSESRNSLSLRDLSLPFVNAESLGSVADAKIESGKNRFSHEGGKRTLVVSSNYQGRDIVGDVEKIKEILTKTKLPTGVTVSYEGTYKSQKENSRRLAILFGLGLLLIFGILYKAFRSVPLVLQIMLNIPTVFIGGIIGVWMTGGIINLAHLIGFISLAGIVSRNGIMLLGRCLQLVRKEQEPFSPETILKATLDRVVPVLMTSLVTALALIPLMLAGGEPGKELLNPLAVVIFGGLVSSTAISLFLTPAVFYRFGKKAATQSEVDTSGF